LVVLENIKLKLGKLKLKKKLKKQTRNIKTFSLEKASSIGVVYDATNRNDYEAVKKFIHFLKEERKDVLSLGYINSKDASEIVRPHLNYVFFDKKNLSKSMIPHGLDVDNFINKPYSILIDLNINNCFPIECITSLSKARFKVGASGNYRDAICDLTIDVKNNKSVDFLIIQIKHYLSMIHN